MDQTLLDLKIVAQIQQNGRIRTSAAGHIELERDAGTYTSAMRSINSDSRRKAIRDLKELMVRAFTLADGLLASKYVNIYEFTHTPDESQIENHQLGCQRLAYLRDELGNAQKGIKSLMSSTYKDDGTIVAELSLVLRDMKNKVQIIGGKLDRLAKSRTSLPNTSLAANISRNFNSNNSSNRNSNKSSSQTNPFEIAQDDGNDSDASQGSMPFGFNDLEE